MELAAPYPVATIAATGMIFRRDVVGTIRRREGLKTLAGLSLVAGSKLSSLDPYQW